MIKALVITLIVELSMLYFFKEKDYKVYVLSALINVITNLSLNYMILNIDFTKMVYYYLFVGILEVIIVFIEALAYMLYYKKFKKAFLISLILNSTSFLVGLFINALEIIN